MNASFYVLVLVVMGSWLPAAAQGQAVQARRDSVDRIWKKKADSLSALRQYRQAGDSLQLVGWVDSVKQRVNTFFSSREQPTRAALDILGAVATFACRGRNANTTRLSDQVLTITNY